MAKSLKGKELGAGFGQRKDGVYYGMYKNLLGEKQFVYDSDEKVMRIKLDEAKAKVLMKVPVSNISNMSLDDWFEEWDKTYLAIGSESTRDVRNTDYNNIVRKRLGQMKVSQIKQIHILNLMIEMKNCGYAYNRQRNVIGMLSKLFNDGRTNGIFVNNPASDVRPASPKPNKEPRAFTQTEYDTFFEYARGTFYYDLWVFMVNTGLRISETAGLRWEDIDFDKRIIHVRNQMLYNRKNEYVLTDVLKTPTSKRDVVMTDECFDALVRQKRRKEIMSKTMSPKKDGTKFPDQVFVGKTNNPIAASHCSYLMRDICKEINLSLEPSEKFEYPISTHIFRHTFATRCIEAGVKPKTLQKLLGHSNIRTTMDTYVTLTEEHRAEEVEKLSSLNKQSVVTKTPAVVIELPLLDVV